MINMTNIFSLLLMLYIASVIVFKQNYMIVAHTIDLLMIGLFVLLVLKERSIRTNPIINIYFAFMIFSLLSSLWAISFDETSFKSLQMFIIVINLLVIYNLMMTFNIKDFYMKGILLGSFINYIIVLGLVVVPFDIVKGERFFGTLGNPNDLAVFMLISIFISTIYLFDNKSEKRWFYYYQYINILLALYMILLTVSKKGIIFGSLLFLAYIAISLKSKEGIKRIFLLSIIGTIIIFFFIDWGEVNKYFENVLYRFDAFSSALDDRGGMNNSTEIRKQLISFGLLAFQGEPLFGYGLGNFRFISGGQYAHNNFVELLVGVGLIGFFIFYLMYAYLFYILFRIVKIESDLKKLFLIFLSILLGMDAALVSYGDKTTMYLLVFMYVYILQELMKDKTLK